MLSPQLIDRTSGVGLLQNGHDLRFGELRLSHGNFLARVTIVPECSPFDCLDLGGAYHLRHPRPGENRRVRYIEYLYSPRWRHSTLGYLSSMKFERQAERAEDGVNECGSRSACRFCLETYICHSHSFTVLRRRLPIADKENQESRKVEKYSHSTKQIQDSAPHRRPTFTGLIEISLLQLREGIVSVRPVHCMHDNSAY